MRQVMVLAVLWTASCGAAPEGATSEWTEASYTGKATAAAPHAVRWRTSLGFRDAHEAAALLDGPLPLAADDPLKMSRDDDLQVPHTVPELRRLLDLGYAPADNYAIATLGKVNALVVPALAIQRARPSRVSSMPVDLTKEDVLALLPARLGPIVASEDEAIEAEQRGVTLGEFWPDARVVRRSASSVELAVDGYRLIVDVDVVGDLESDGLEDWLVSVATTPLELGTYHTFLHAALCRTKANGPLVFACWWPAK